MHVMPLSLHGYHLYWAFPSGKRRFGLGLFGCTAFRQEVAAWVRLVI